MIRFLLLSILLIFLSACGTMSLPTAGKTTESVTSAGIQTPEIVLQDSLAPGSSIDNSQSNRDAAKQTDKSVTTEVIVHASPPVNILKPTRIEESPTPVKPSTELGTPKRTPKIVGRTPDSEPQKITFQTGSTLAEILKNNGVIANTEGSANTFAPKKSELQQTQKSPPKVTESVEPIKKIVKPPVPSEDDLKYTLAKKYYDKGKYQNSIDVLESSNRASLKNFKLRDLLVLSYTKYARKLVSKAELIEAQIILEKAVGMEPNNKVLKQQLHGVRNVMESNQVFDSALQQYTRGKRMIAFQSFGRVLSLNPRHKKAKKYYNEIKTEVVDAYHKKALQFYRQQELSSAIGEWNRLLKIDPGNDLARIYKSRAVELKRKFDNL